VKYYLEIERLSALVRSKRSSQALREAALEIGISPSTLLRLEKEQHAPDMETFTALCNWLDVPPSTFFRGAEISNPLSVPEAIALQLQSDKNLDPVTANVLAILVKAAYRDLQK
jgi:transcriptional regulator with XRE-family HTH domain